MWNRILILLAAVELAASPANRLALHGPLTESGLAEVQAALEKALLGGA